MLNFIAVFVSFVLFVSFGSFPVWPCHDEMQRRPRSLGAFYRARDTRGRRAGARPIFGPQ
jgi:hypothetical protein